MFYDNDRSRMRTYYFEVWEKLKRNAPLEPLETLIAEVLTQHPEYHALFDAGIDALDRDFPPHAGQTNPFLHMGLHLAVREQATTDRPAGIAMLYRELLQRAPDPHTAEHRMMDCLAAALWEAQRAGTLPDDARYLECLRAAFTHG